MLTVSQAGGDILTTRDGRVFDGFVISRNGGKVVFEVRKYGATMRMQFDPADIASLRSAPVHVAPRRSEPEPDPQPVAPEAPSPAELPPLAEAPPIVHVSGPSYCVIPLYGQIGVDIVAGVLDQALADALKRKPSVIVLEMDSPGGLVREVEPLIGTIQKYRDARLVLVVHNAISAAAITGLSVREIYMTSNSIFGAATAFRVTPDGTPQDIEEKMRSVWRAVARNQRRDRRPQPAIGSGDDRRQIRPARRNRARRQEGYRGGRRR